ncbi:MAG TPA: hypothetical protein VF194_06370, partial [Ferrovibrio sp.]|uniref:hypothetical protein n=1 Tax=Ferrovibrio sp. TaxID=1917215 RepID=UPI002ED3F97A
PGGAPHWQFFADPGGDNYRKYLSFKPAGALSHLHGIESFDLAALERFLSAGGELAGWQVIAKNHFGGYRELVAL